MTNPPSLSNLSSLEEGAESVGGGSLSSRRSGLGAAATVALWSCHRPECAEDPSSRNLDRIKAYKHAQDHVERRRQVQLIRMNSQLFLASKNWSFALTVTDCCKIWMRVTEEVANPAKPLPS